MTGDALSEWLLAAARFLWYAGVAGVTGASVFRLLLAATGGSRHVSPALRAGATTGLVAAAALLGGVAARLYAQTYAYFGMDEGVTRDLLIETAARLPPWSRGWMLQAAAALASAAALAVARVAPAAGWPAAHVAALAVVATVPMTGHAVAQEDWPRLPIVLQAGHVLGAGAWLGGLLMLLVATSRAPRPTPAAVTALVARFSPVALAGAGLVVATGVGTAALYLDRMADLWTTAYGRMLAVKILGFGGVAAAGFVNWQLMRPRLLQPGGVAALRRVAAVELSLAGVVLAVTAWLVGLPQP